MPARAGLPVMGRFYTDGPRPVWATPAGHVCARVARGWAARESVLFFQRISKGFSNLVLSRSLENYGKLCRYPKIVKQNLLGSQKYCLSVGVVSLQLSMIMIDS